MTREQTAALLAYLTRLNPAMRVVEGMLDAWHDQLAGFEAAEVETAAKLVGGDQTWVGVADIRGAVWRARAERLRRAGNLQELVTADPDRPDVWLAEFRRLHAEVASGRRPLERREVTSGE